MKIENLKGLKYEMLAEICDEAIKRGEPVIIDGDPYDPVKLKATLEHAAFYSRWADDGGPCIEVDRDP